MDGRNRSSWPIRHSRSRTTSAAHASRARVRQGIGAKRLAEAVMDGRER